MGYCPSFFICNFMFRMRSSRVFKNIFSILSREMKLVSLLVLVLLSIQSSYGQQVSGVVQHDNNAIEYCNVMVKNVEWFCIRFRNSNRPIGNLRDWQDRCWQLLLGSFMCRLWKTESPLYNYFQPEYPFASRASTQWNFLGRSYSYGFS